LPAPPPSALDLVEVVFVLASPDPVGAALDLPDLDVVLAGVPEPPPSSPLDDDPR
jgi:hypothetical protein